MKEINLRKVPPERVIEQLIGEIREKFPALYRVLIEERNKYMAHQISALEKHFPDKKILVIVGAGHKKGLVHLLDR